MYKYFCRGWLYGFLTWGLIFINIIYIKKFSYFEKSLTASIHIY
nr:MAG TPA: hypothetical protein [Bacteriophage sp.]